MKHRCSREIAEVWGKFLRRMQTCTIDNVSGPTDSLPDHIAVTSVASIDLFEGPAAAPRPLTQRCYSGAGVVSYDVVFAVSVFAVPFPRCLIGYVRLERPRPPVALLQLTNPAAHYYQCYSRRRQSPPDKAPASDAELKGIMMLKRHSTGKGEIGLCPIARIAAPTRRSENSEPMRCSGLRRFLCTPRKLQNRSFINSLKTEIMIRKPAYSARSLSQLPRRPSMSKVDNGGDEDYHPLEDRRLQKANSS